MTANPGMWKSIWGSAPVTPFSEVRGHYLVMLGYGKLLLEWREGGFGNLRGDNIPQIGLDGVV